VWVGDRLFTDTGAFFAVKPDEVRFDFDPQPVPDLQAIEWNDRIQAVVGRVPGGLAAWDPTHARMLWESPSDKKGSPWCDLSATTCVRKEFGTHPAPDRIHFVDGDTGASLGSATPASPRAHRLVFGPRGRLAVTSHVHVIGGDSQQRRLEVFSKGQQVWQVGLGDRRVAASHSIAEATGIGWSRSESQLALLLNGQQVRIVDAGTGAFLADFHAPAPAMPDGLPEWYTRRRHPERGFPGDLLWVGDDHIVRIASHFVSVWTPTGDKVGELVVTP